MGALCNSETKPKQNAANIPEKKEQIKLQLKGGSARKSNQVTDVEEKLKLILSPGEENIEELKVILNSGKIDFNNHFEKEDNETILTLAIKSNSKPEIIQVILDMGADVNLCEKSSGHSPLILACLNLNKKVVELILKQNPQINTVVHHDENGNEHKADLIEYLKLKFSSGKLNKLKGENTLEEIIEVLEIYIKNKGKRQ